MKKMTATITLVVMLLALFLSALPTNTVLAKKDGNSAIVSVRNRTDGTVNIDLIDENGTHHGYTYEPGMHELSVLQGHYQYYASTPCGMKSGEFTLDGGKFLFLSCKSGVEVKLIKPTKKAIYCYAIYDYWNFTGWEYAYMGDYCQDTPAYEGQNISYVVPDPSASYTGIATYYESGAAACAPDYGPAFYYNDCAY